MDEEDIFGSHPEPNEFSVANFDRTCDASRATPHPNREEILYQILQKTFRFQEFRPKQLDAINATLDGRDVLVRFPTSGGKSLCFQLPAIYDLHNKHATTFVIQPNVSLIQNQVAALRKLQVATEIFEPRNTRRQADYWKALVENANIPLCFFTPQMMRMSEYLRDVLGELLSQNRIARFVIDEVHLILKDEKGEHGEAFRDLCSIRASDRLGMQDVGDFVTTEIRANLRYSVVFRDGIYMRNVRLLIKFLEEHKREKGLIFCRRVNECKKLAKDLQEKNWSTHAYYARLKERDTYLEEFTQPGGGVNFLVTTNALGIGVNLPNLKYVIHWDPPYSFEEYLQQSGRAGRNGEAAECVLFFSPHSMSRQPHGAPELSDREIQQRNHMIRYAMNRNCRQTCHPYATQQTLCGVCDNCERKSLFVDMTKSCARTHMGSARVRGSAPSTWNSSSCALSWMKFFGK
ncbi:P-loop containing nucleoside triphosphate hydrolase protein [Cantharellus anzutake]|uniref:P-loop containing nucleoside triphosphate hydrolase protein n=1 Tax=Cantharellus anzutake TaxID=1750568 RepID=UPI001906801A|nr:P-loop containing nucleoside triphosphate hydrolase protein [Cantharellus anzutake]KAF8339819.1 P-loop containing nucleoside triphosphate hydrolase protein [Cantharellus anzutake]